MSLAHGHLGLGQGQKGCSHHPTVRTLCLVVRRKVIQEPTWNLLGKSHPGSWLASPTPTLPLTRPEAVRQVIFLKFNLSLNLSIRKKKKNGGVPIQASLGAGKGMFSKVSPEDFLALRALTQRPSRSLPGG